MIFSGQYVHDEKGQPIYPFMEKYTKPVHKAEREIIGREAEKDSVMAAMSRPELCNVILLAEPGAGKALADDTLIPVADDRGYVPIGQLKVGDQVFDKNGMATTVLGVFHQGLKDAYEVCFTDGSRIVCNDEHIWCARKHYEHYMGMSYGEYTLRQMMDFGIQKPITRSSNGKSYTTSVKCWHIPICAPLARSFVSFEIDPYAMGVLLANNSTENGNIAIVTKDDSFADLVAKKLGNLVCHKSAYNSSWVFQHANQSRYIRADDYSAEYDCALRCPAAMKRIPRKYFLGCVEQRQALLFGLMDVDGTVSGDSRANCFFRTASSGLAQDVIELANSLGIRAVNTTHPFGIKSKEYVIHFLLGANQREAMFQLDEKKQRARQRVAKVSSMRSLRNIYGDMTVESVKKQAGQVPMTCIYVDSPDHLYVAGTQHIVTHNTALVQGLMLDDNRRYYVEVDLSRMIADLVDKNQMADKLKSLFEEVERYCRTEHCEVVLFIDEFHQVVELSPAAVEALKPLLADSGTRGIRVIAATTFEEFRKWVSPNQALVERLHRINVNAPSKEMVVEILRGMARRYGVDNHFYNDYLFEEIYDLTNRYVPANSQPRKSILLFDAMLGWYHYKRRPLDKNLLADVIYETEGVNIAFRVDSKSIKQRLDAEVYSQEYATTAIQNRLQICVADLNNKTKPMSSFLFVGSTGTGKTEMAKQLASVLFNDSRRFIRFDMTEYANKDSLDMFRKELTNRVWERPYSVVLLDEVEKACGPVVRLLLQVLDDGRLTDENGREVPFINCYIVMTSNAGTSAVYNAIGEYKTKDMTTRELLIKYDKLIRRAIQNTTGDNKFPPELLGRIDCIVPFLPLDLETQHKVVRKQCRRLVQDVLSKHGVRVQISAKVIEYLVRDAVDTDSSAGGARAAISKLETEVTSAVATALNENPHITRMTVDVSGKAAYEDKKQLESKAFIQVTFA